MSTPMTFAKDDTVILLPSCEYFDCAKNPIWGGKSGYVLGHIVKVLTHDHDPAKHTARVMWDNKNSDAYAQRDLMHASGDMVDWSKDLDLKVDPDIDINLLLWTGKDFALGVIEPGYAMGGRMVWSLFLTRQPVDASSQNDWSLFETFLSSKDLTETTHASLYDAMTAFHQFWELPPFRALPMPLTQCKNIREATKATALKPNEPQLARFTLPNRLTTYVIESGVAGS